MHAIVYLAVGFIVVCACVGIEKIRPLWRWVEKQNWWKEIENDG